jgi:hypothetical protein
MSLDQDQSINQPWTPSNRGFLSVGNMMDQRTWDVLVAYEQYNPSVGHPLSLYAHRTYITPEGETRYAWQGFMEVLQGQRSWNDLQLELRPVAKYGGGYTGADWFEEFRQQTEQNQRAYDRLLSGPGYTQNDIDNLYAVLKDRASVYGLAPDDERLMALARTAVQYNYNETRIIDGLLEGINFAEINTGSVEQQKQDIKAFASKYLLYLNDADIDDYTARIFRGEMDVDSLRSSLASLASVNMPFLTSYMDRGFTPIDVFKSPMNLAANELGVDIAEIDIMDPDWQSILIRTNDKGESRVATNQEVRDSVRQMEGWEKTQKAQNTAMDVGMWLGEIMGAI